MNAFALTLLLVSAVALLLAPRRWAPVPLIAGTCYMTLGQGFDVGPFSFTVIRVLVLVGVFRAIVRGERIAGGLNLLDWFMLAWSAWAVINSAFHEDAKDSLIFRVGLVYNSAGIYFLLRVLCQSMEDVVRLCKVTALLLVPVAAEMLYERVTLHNLFSVLGGVPDVPQIREGKVRASGPFAHPILAGTVGAVCLPLMIGLWHLHRKTAIFGAAVCLTIVVCSASSGPFVSAIGAVFALSMWRYRSNMRQFRWAALAIYVVLDLTMKAPPYYLIARIDLAGGSTGFHRARLIESAFEHLGEWWVAGTDFTRHWMPTGVSWSPNHTDITNHYLNMGVLGGLPLMLLFIATIVVSFSFVGRCIKAEIGHSPQRAFVYWSLGAAMFAHLATCISVSYFDQSFVFLYLTQAAIASAYAESRARAKAGEREPATATPASVYSRSAKLRRRPSVASPIAIRGTNRSAPSAAAPTRNHVGRRSGERAK